eukprot:s3524_g14.t1
MHHFSGHQSRRACALWGPEGIGKSALGVEFLHFAAAPGRHFSCCAGRVHIEAMDLVGIANAVNEELESLAVQSQAVNMQPFVCVLAPVIQGAHYVQLVCRPGTDSFGKKNLRIHVFVYNYTLENQHEKHYDVLVLKLKQIAKSPANRGCIWQPRAQAIVQLEMTNGANPNVTQMVPVSHFASDCDEQRFVQTEDWRRLPGDASQGLGVFVKDPTEQQSLSDLEDVEEEWKKLDPTSDILEMVNSKEFIGERPAFEHQTPQPPGLAGKDQEALESMESPVTYPDFDYYSSFGYGQAQQVPDGQGMYGSFTWQTMQGYPYFDQWQAATSIISAFQGYYDFVPTKSGKRGRGKQGDMWIDKAATEKRPSVALGVDASDPRRIVWTLEKASLTSKNKDREKVSPSFRIPMGGQDVEFKLNLFATSVSSNRHCSSFKKAKGKGHVALRCVQSINECTQPTLKFRIILGEGFLQSSSFTEHNFAEKQICTVPPSSPETSLKGGEEEWDFLNADSDKLTFVVVLEVRLEDVKMQLTWQTVEDCMRCSECSG